MFGNVCGYHTVFTRWKPERDVRQIACHLCDFFQMFQRLYVAAIVPAEKARTFPTSNRLRHCFNPQRGRQRFKPTLQSLLHVTKAIITAQGVATRADASLNLCQLCASNATRRRNRIGMARHFRRRGESAHKVDCFFCIHVRESIPRKAQWCNIFFEIRAEKVIHKIQAQAHVGMVRATQQSSCQAKVGMELAARSLCKSLIIKHLRGAPPTPT